ncbi:MAG TPA: ATP-binding protein [Candidatus Polarisedimenticolia bacterium]|nr:ATP-binding protein [Candidatus Polarisedimenticolia bacterium]
MHVRIGPRFLLAANLAGIVPLACAGGLFWYLTSRAGLAQREALLAAVAAGLAAIVVMAFAASRAGVTIDRRVLAALESARGQERPVEARRGAADSPDPGEDRSISLGSLRRLADALSAEARALGIPIGPSLRRFLLFCAPAGSTWLAIGASGRQGAVDVNAAVEVCVKAIQAAPLGDSGAPVTFDPAPDAGLAPLSADALHRVLLELIVNAREAAGPLGCVQIRTQSLGDQILVAVRDDGPGVSHQDLSRLFRPFHSTRQGAMGLGLALCRRIVEACGGTIGAVNVLPRGLEVAMRVPAIGPSATGRPRPGSARDDSSLSDADRAGTVTRA